MGYAPIPESVTIEINYNCMLRCKMCNMWSEDFKKSRIGDNKNLSKAELERIISELSSIGVASIYFCGGEPFLRKDFLDIVAFCKSKGLRCSTISNGYLIGEDLARRIILSGIDSIGISMDASHSSLHDEIRGVEGVFARAVGAIKNLKKLQEEGNTEVPEIFINCTVSSMNFLDLPKIVDLAKSLKVNRIHFNYISVLDMDTVKLSNECMGENIIAVHTFAGISPDFLLGKEEIDKLEALITDIRERAGSEIRCDIDPALLRGDKKLLMEGKFRVLKCRMPWSSSMITPTGNVVPCAMFTDCKIGNVREEPFRKIFNNKKAVNIRRKLYRKLPPVCQKCCMVHEGVPSLWKRLYHKVANTAGI